MFDVLDIWFSAPDFVGCLFINTAAEFPNPNDAVHQAAAERKLAFRNEIRDMAIAGELPKPDAFPDHYTLIFEGSLIMRQVHWRNDAARLEKNMVQAMIPR